MSATAKLTAIAKPLIWFDEQVLADVVNLGLRIWVAKIFFMSGLTKIQSIDSKGSGGAGTPGKAAFSF